MVWMGQDEKKLLKYISIKEGISMSKIARMSMEVFMLSYLRAGPEALADFDDLSRALPKEGKTS